MAQLKQDTHTPAQIPVFTFKKVHLFKYITKKLYKDNVYSSHNVL